MSTSSGSHWTAGQLVEFLAAVSAHPSADEAVRAAVERAAEAVDAEVAAFVRGDQVVAALGFPTARTPEADLLAAADGRRDTLDVPGCGPVPVARFPLPEEAGVLLICRSQDPLVGHELALGDGMARVLELVLRLLGVLDGERALRTRLDSLLDDAVHRALHDPLTQLPNRSAVLERLDAELGGGRRDALAVLFVDLDHFKMIDDSFGHPIGDEVLLRVAERLVGSVRPEDLVARLAGDEFVVLADGLGEREAIALAQRLANVVSAPLTLYGREAVITASVGVNLARPGQPANEVLRDADVAMYRAKQRGRDRIEVFDETMRTTFLDRVELEQELRQAADREELRLHYQPIVDLSTGEVAAFEALVRWQHPTRGLLGPDRFIPLAEEAGFIRRIGEWVLERACYDLAAWKDQGLDNLAMAVNLSAGQFADPALSDLVARVLARHGLPGRRLTLEITESVLAEEVEVTTETLHRLKGIGCRIAVDDFGTGYSSLVYLKRFPLDALKIDRTFVDGLAEDAGDRAIALAVIRLAQTLGLRTVGEGVGTGAQLAALRALGCGQAQGYHLGRPVPPEQVPAAVARIEAMRSVTVRPSLLPEHSAAAV